MIIVSSEDLSEQTTIGLRRLRKCHFRMYVRVSLVNRTYIQRLGLGARGWLGSIRGAGQTVVGM